MTDSGYWQYRVVNCPSGLAMCAASKFDQRNSILWENIKLQFPDIKVQRRWVTSWEDAP